MNGGHINLLLNMLHDMFVNISTYDIADRLHEFEVIKGDDIDYISLNNVFDFYNIKFDQSEFESQFLKQKEEYNKILSTFAKRTKENYNKAFN